MMNEYDSDMTDIQDIIDAFILTMDPSLQSDATDYWAYYIAYFQVQIALDYEYNQLVYLLGSVPADNIDQILYNLAFYSYPYDETNYNTYLDFYNQLLDGYSDQTEVIDWILQYHDDYMTYFDIQVNDLEPSYQALVTNPSYIGFLSLVEDNIYDYASLLSMYAEAENHFNEYTQYIDELYDTLWFEYMVYDLMHDPTYSAEFAEVVGYLIDDAQNMFASMPDDSFALIASALEFIKQIKDMTVYASAPEFVFDPSMIDFTAQEIFDFTQDLSAFLKLRGETLTTEEIAAIEQFLLDAVTVYVNQMDLGETEAADMVIYIYDMITKYIGFADYGLTQLTNILDSLTVEQVQGIMDYIKGIMNNEYNIYTMVITGAQLLSPLVDPAQVDLVGIAHILNEIYV
ncbi:MAG TPA: hypothetical protein PK113_05565, partial [Bacillota bacterium]|nr:hypothetical protein [Bacillota bacterium]